MQTTPLVDYKNESGKIYIKIDPKINVYKVVVLTALVYDAESCVTYRHHLRFTEHYAAYLPF